MTRRTALAALTCLATLAAAPTATAACGGVKQAHARGDAKHRGRPPLILGDSTLLLAVGRFGAAGIEANARGCRQYSEGLRIIRGRKRAGTLPAVVVVALGANGPVSRGQIAATLRTIGSRRILVLVTPRNSASTRASMRRAARAHPDRVLVADWAGYSRRRGGGWFAGDGLHVSHTGARARAAAAAPQHRCCEGVRERAPTRPQGPRLRRPRPGAGDVPAGAGHRASPAPAAPRRLARLRLATHGERAVAVGLRPHRPPRHRRDDRRRLTPSSTVHGIAPTGLTPARKRLILAAAIMGSFVAGLDATVINVALPAIEQDLGGGLAGQQWVSNAYLLTLGSLILIGGSLGDVYGERRVFALGVAGFGVASLGCALAPTIEALIGARAIQGVFGALLTPSALAVIVNAFPADERGAAIGSWTAWAGIATVVGPFVGGWLIDAASWRWIFAINVPFVLATIVLVAVAVPPPDHARTARRVDWLGAALCAIGLAGPVYALIRQPDAGWGSPEVAGPLIGGVAVFSLFLVREARTADPMLPLGLFRRRNFAVGNLETFSMYGGLAILFFFLVLFLQQVAGFTALQAGLATLPSTLVMFVLSKRFGALADRFGPRFFMGAGPLVSAAGLAWFLRVGADVDYVTDVLPGLLVFSLGLAMTVAPLTATVLADADESNAGIASGVNNAIARVAGLLGIAALGAVVAAVFAAAIDDRLAGTPLTPGGQRAVAAAKQQSLGRADTTGLEPAEARAVSAAVQDASVDAFRRAMAISAALVGLGGLLGLVGIANPRRAVEAQGCPGGQIAGVPEDLGETFAAGELPDVHLPAAGHT